MPSLFGNNNISDCANPRPVHREVYVDTITRSSGYREQPVFTDKPPAIGHAERPETRTQRFREMRLVPHVGGVLACSFCHFAPYYCQCCSGLKCRCTVDGVYRHWTNGVPIPTLKEVELLEEVSL